MVSYQTTKRIFLLLTFFALVVALYLSLANNAPLAIGFISICIASLSVYLTIHSIKIAEDSSRIAEESKKIANDSDEKMKTIALAIYHETEGDFEDKRLMIMENRRKLETKIRKKIKIDEVEKYTFEQDIIFSIWKCLTYLQKAEPLIKWTGKPKRERFIHLLEQFYKELERDIRRFEVNITKEYREQLRKMYDIVSEFEIFNKNYIDDRHKPNLLVSLESVLKANDELLKKKKRK